MGFWMASPFRHPKTGIYYLRKVVPLRLRGKIGKREIKISLGTRNPAEAKLRIGAESARVEAMLADAENLRSLTFEQVKALAGEWYRDRLALDQQEPGDADGLGHLLDDLRQTTGPAGRAKEVGDSVVELLDKKGLVVDEESRRRLIDAVFENYTRLIWMLAKRAEGDYTADPMLDQVPAFKRDPKKPSVSMLGLIEAWKNENRPAERTVYEWTRGVDRLKEFVGHDDATRVAPEDVIKWKDQLLASGKSTKTTKNHLSVVHAIFAWAKKNRRLSDNPAAGITVPVKRKPGEERKPYSEDDAKLILTAARKESGGLRWVPWLLAYTGARLSEVCQCNAEDIRKEQGVWVIDFHAFNVGSSLKNMPSVRLVPIHSALLKEGLLEFVTQRPKGSPLFPDFEPDRFGKRSGNGGKLIGRWVRKLGISDIKKAPSHSWRHRFKDVCREAGISAELHNELTGHRDSGVARSYGSRQFPLKVLYEAIRKIAAVKL